jgi:hypothetical protein
MARSKADDEMTPIAKYEVFKRAFDTINFFIQSGNLIGAFVLSFSILEDRMRAAMVDCFNKVKEPLGSEEISNIPFKILVKRLKRVGAIDGDLEKRLLSAADLRNNLTHQMMWRLDVFSLDKIDSIRTLINDVKRAHRYFVKKCKFGE